MNNSDLEVQTTQRVREALQAAIQRTGKEEFAKASGTESDLIDKILTGRQEFVAVAMVALACQINRSQSDPNRARTSISECLKGAIWRLPQEPIQPKNVVIDPSTLRARRAQFLKAQKRAGGIYDPSTLRILGFSVNLFTFVILGYFLGGIVLGPIFGLGQCIGVVASSPWLVPCAGSGIGLVLGFVAGLAYTYYYFVKRL